MKVESRTAPTTIASFPFNQSPPLRAETSLPTSSMLIYSRRSSRRELPRLSKTEEWTGRLILVGFGIYVLVFIADIAVKLILGVPLTFGPLFESPEFRVMFKIVVNRASGKQVFQVHQSHIFGSNVVGTAREVHFHEAPAVTPAVAVEREREDWGVDQKFTLEPDGYREFPFDLENGDELVGYVEAEGDVSCYVLGRVSFSSFEDGENFNPYWENEDVTRTKVSFVAEGTRTYFFVVYRDENEDEDVSVSVKLRVES